MTDMRTIMLATSGIWTVFATPCAAQSVADPGCRVRIEAPTSNWVIRGYDPFSVDAPTASFDVTFINEGDAQCAIRPTFDLVQSGFGLEQGNQPRLAYTLIDMFGGYDATPRTGSTQHTPTQRLVVIEPQAQQVVTFRFGVLPDGIRTDGLFSQSVQILAETSLGEPVGSRQLTLGLDVQPSVLMGLAGAFRRAEGRAFVDLGELREGVVDTPLNLYVQSTRGYRLTLQSQNGGQLRLGGSDWSVPYQIMLGDRSMPLTGDAIYTSPTGTALVREQIPMRFSISNLGGKRAGIYSDVVTITVAVD